MKTISLQDREQVKRRIAALETRSDAEVVCAVATESGRYDRAESLSGLLAGLTFLIAGNKVVSMGGWDAPSTLSLPLQVLLLVAGFVAGSVLASYWHGLRRLLVRKAELAAEVNRSAYQVFSRHGIGATRHRGGLLIYVSLFERRLEVLCDRSVAEKTSQSDLDAIRDLVLAKVRQGELMEGLIAGLERAEEILAKALPATQDLSDTLANDLLLFHPRP